MTLPYDYYPAILYAIDLISQGQSETRACDASNITINVFRQHVNASAELSALAQEAFQRGYDAMAEALLDPDNHALYGHSDAKMAKVQSDNIKWFLSKKKPREYGEKITIEHNITADKAITDALAAGRKRAALAYTDMIDVTPVLVDDALDLSEEAMLAELLS